jgi:hypothetical protein
LIIINDDDDDDDDDNNNNNNDNDNLNEKFCAYFVWKIFVLYKLTV